MQRLLAVVFLLIGLVGPLRAEPPAAVARLIPADAGMVVQVDDLAGALERTRDGKWYARLETFRPWAQWREKNGAVLEGLFAAVAKELNVSTDELWSKVLGGRLTLVLWAPTVGQSGEGARMLIVQAQDAAALERLAQGFLKAQARSHKLAWKEREHRGQKYHASAAATGGSKSPPAADGGEAFFLASWAETGVLTDSESALRRVLDLRAASSGSEPERLVDFSPESLAAQAAWQSALKHVPSNALVTVFVNPRAWDAALESQIEQGASSSAASEKQRSQQALLETWRAVKFGVLSFELGDRLAAQAVVEFDPQALPEQVREVVQAFSGESKFFEKTPADCLIAAAGRIDVARLVETFGDSPSGERSAGDAIGRRVMSMVGPDMGAFLLHRPDAEMPDDKPSIDWAIGLGLREKWTDDQAKAVASTLRSLAPRTLAFAAKAIKGSPVNWLPTLAGTRWDQVELGDVFPIADAEAFSVAGGFMWGGTSSEVIQSAAKLAADKSLRRSPRFAAALSPAASDPSLAVYVDLAGMRSFLNDHADALVSAVAASSDVPQDVAKSGVAQLTNLLQLGDTLVAAVSVSESGTLAASISLSVDAPR